MPDQSESCGRTAPHPAHKFMQGRHVSRCSGVAPSSPVGVSAPDPLAPFRALADQYAAKAAESRRNAGASTIDEARAALPDIAAGWRSAEFLLRHVLTDLDNGRTTPNNPAASDGSCSAATKETEPNTSPDGGRLRALARNAVGPALNAHGEWLPLSVREAVADAVLAVLEGELEQMRAASARVRAIHAPVTHNGNVICVDCSSYFDGSCEDWPYPYPCWTITNLDGPPPPPNDDETGETTS